ncbi:hypothetical protein [Paraburkholderia sp. BL10I2N1]|uniref:hypothetical protein n=1 Tax=Paraburkholderia sp. BL10I2N1 TaxID=1938796 RepID=UPI00105D6479|nr:hypothetical protein [Paraburkholderia sp. BL10I2N1]TDN58972.1 hypothetical protein B0G77_8155 [Paraburkholderia sp. BL10I2N1]
MNHKRPSIKKETRAAVIKDCDAIIRISAVLAVLGTVLYWGLLETLFPIAANGPDRMELGAFLMAFGLLGIVAAGAVRSIAEDG